MPEIENAIAELGKTFEQFKAANDAALQEMKKGSADYVTTDKVERINAALDTLTQAKEALDKKAADAEKRADELEKRLNRHDLSGSKDGVDPEIEAKQLHASRVSLIGATSPLSSEDVQSYKSGFSKLIRRGEAVFTDAERKAMVYGSDPDGGYLVTPTISNKIVTRLFETSPLRAYADVVTIGSDALEGLRDTDEAGSGGWVGETTSPTETTTPQLGKWRIPVHQQFVEPRATQTLLDDANIDVESWLAMKVADKMARIENTAFVNGTGSGQPQGFCTYSTAATADASRAWGTFEHVATGVNGGFAVSKPADVFFDLEVAFKPGYLTNARFYTRRSVVQTVRKIKDGEGNYLWQPGLSAGVPQTLIGYGISLLEDMPALGSGSLSLAFGDMRQTYTIVDRAGFRTIRDNLTAKPYVKFYTTKRVGGGALNFETLKFIKFGT